MPTSNETPPDDTSLLNPVTELKGLMHVLATHFRDLSELFKIEAAEAGQFAGRKAALGAVAAGLSVIFYLLLLVGLIGWLPTLLDCPWYLVAFGLAVLHLLALLIVFIALKQKPKQPFFSATKAQLEKDKQCLAPANKAENKS